MGPCQRQNRRCLCFQVSFSFPPDVWLGPLVLSLVGKLSLNTGPYLYTSLRRHHSVVERGFNSTRPGKPPQRPTIGWRVVNPPLDHFARSDHPSTDYFGSQNI